MKDDTVNFTLKMQLPSTNHSGSANAASGPGEASSNMDSKNISVDGGCVDAVRDLLESSNNQKLRLTFGGIEYSPDQM